MTRQSSSLNLIRRPGTITFGIELPLDNDWAPEREARRIEQGRPFGVPDLRHYPELVQQVDRSGFAAVWMRDVPIFDPNNFGDAGSVYDPFVNLGFLAGITKNVALGTAAIVLPMRHPMMVAKAAASVDVLSAGRLILGVASGDRPVEYPLLGLDFENRGDAFRDAITYLRAAWQSNGLPVGKDDVEPALDLLPKPVRGSIPMIIAGQGRQTPEWIAGHMDGRFVYPNDIDRFATRAGEWRSARVNNRMNEGAFVSAFHLDLAANPEEPVTPRRFGARLGRNAFIEHLHNLNAVGVDHLALLLRPSRRPLDEVIDELARDVLPLFNKPVPTAVQTAAE
ncbi:LLM class oxidoreductase [Phyllobacterium myrsinacearum]|uniref:Luciferase-type oxidoreductase n=1 Tax=Phyllobacterium myrsinacearum TaxID=28101 RepID=A0A839ENF8_9HYPH|nr:LLM class oxidoreductase [Phyllobacterium myrsinacearum]MBA8882153.1 luciferase-type oxidoreductase [Phyllobacterium myrsinacearum]